MSLSSLIVQREVATMRQLEEAMARQVIYGGDLPTNLLEVARVHEETLTRLVAESMNLPAAISGELPVAQARARSLVPAEMAAAQTLVPLALQGDRLVMAVAEPLAPEVASQLGFALGLSIEQRVALAVRIRQAIARVYGVPLERRMQRLIGRMSGESTNSGSMPPPLGASPPVVEPPRPPSAPPPRISSRSMPAARAVAPVESAPALKAAAPASDSSPPSTSVAAAPRSSLLQRGASAGARAARRRRGPVTFEAAKAEAEEAGDRDALLDLFFDFSRQFFEYAALFLVHGDIAEGHDAFGTGASRERVVGIGVPLDLPGLMATAREKRSSIVTRVAADGLEAQLLTDLHRSREAEIAIVPLVVRTRAVALLVGDCAEAGVDRGNLQHVVAFAGVIGKAFERIIVRRKLDGFIAGSRATGAGKVDPQAVPSKPRSMPPPVMGSTPPPPSNVATSRPIAGPPIPREEPESPRSGPAAARVAARTPPPPPFRPRASSPPPPEVELVEVGEDDTSALFDELGWETPLESDPPPPPSAAISVPAHAPPTRVAHRESLPSVIVDLDDDLRDLVSRAIAGELDDGIDEQLLRLGDRAMKALMARFPGPVTHERARIAGIANPPRVSDCGPVLRLVARQRKLALPFVIERLADPDPEVRGWATLLMTELPYVEALPQVLERLRDPDPATRAAAALAVAAIGRAAPEDVHDAVVAMTRMADPTERAAAMRVIAELRDPSLVPELVRALGDGDEVVVELAHGALVQVTRQDLGPDARRWLKWWELNAQRHRIEWMIDALTHEVSEIRRAAGDELKALTKEYFGYASDLPARDRERAQQRYRDWWITEGRSRFRRKP